MYSKEVTQADIDALRILTKIIMHESTQYIGECILESASRSLYLTEEERTGDRKRQSTVAYWLSKGEYHD